MKDQRKKRTHLPKQRKLKEKEGNATTNECKTHKGILRSIDFIHYGGHEINKLQFGRPSASD
jgi:hypothetical protein